MPTRKLTNHEIFLRHQKRQQRQRLTTAFMSLDKMWRALNDLDADTRQHLFEILNPEQTPEANGKATYKFMKDLYNAIRSTRRELM